jgi:hypothetical protein
LDPNSPHGAVSHTIEFSNVAVANTAPVGDAFSRFDNTPGIVKLAAMSSQKKTASLPFIATVLLRTTTFAIWFSPLNVRPLTVMPAPRPNCGVLSYRLFATTELTRFTTDGCENAPVSADGSFPFTTEDATDDGPSLPAECESGGSRSFRRDVWMRYRAPCTGIATASVCDADYDTRLAIYDDSSDGSSCPGAIVACNDDACGENGTRSEITFDVVAGQEYLVRIGGRVSAGTGTLELSCEE